MTAGPVLPPMAIVRRHVHVRGVVQGVGFRPFAHALAGRFGVGGHVGNDGAGVFLELEGEESRVDAFLEALRVEAPPSPASSQCTPSPSPLVGRRPSASSPARRPRAP